MISTKTWRILVFFWHFNPQIQKIKFREYEPFFINSGLSFSSPLDKSL